MTKNDGFYKVLFAIELALLPMVIFANLFLPIWTMSLFIIGILVCKIWREIFINRKSRTHALINTIASVAEFGVLLIYLSIQNFLNLALAIASLVLIVLFHLFKHILFTKCMNETIDAVDFCFIIFECITLAALAFVNLSTQPVNIALWSMILATAVSVGYKIYYLFKYEDLFSKIKSLFAKR